MVKYQSILKMVMHVAYQIERNMDKNKMKSYFTGVALVNRVISGGGRRTWGRVVVESIRLSLISSVVHAVILNHG